MSLSQLASRIGEQVMLVPEPQYVNAKRQLAMLLPNEWRIESVQTKRVELKNYQSGHVLLLSEVYIREVHNGRIDLRFKIVVKGKQTIL